MSAETGENGTSKSPLHMIDLIRKKRDGIALDASEIEFIVAGAANETIPMEQLSAWLMAEWLNGLGRSIGAFHLQNTDFQSDSHWGWPDKRGLFDAAGFARDVRAAGLDEVPAFLEIIYPFELADEAVLANITSSVAHCRREYAGQQLEKKQIA